VTEDRLSPKPDEWPSNPYELLGVPFDAELETVRQAYRELIHRYKPERAPEQFRRIREAYDRILNSRRRLSRGSVFPIADQSPYRFENLEQRQPIPELNAAWQFAMAGDTGRAYRELVDLSVTDPDNELHAARRYWLLRLTPAIDPDLSPVDVLYPLIRNQGLRGLAGQLFLGELARRPVESLYKRCSELMHDRRNLPRLRPFLQIRWKAAAVARRWELIYDDLEEIQQADPLGTVHWLWGNVDALRACLAVPPSAGKELKAACLDAVRSSDEWSRETQRLFHEVEEIERLLSETRYVWDWWRTNFDSAAQPPAFWTELERIRGADSSNPVLLQLSLEPTIAEWMNDPVRGLGEMDYLFEYYPGHAVLLSNLIEKLPSAEQAFSSMLRGGELRQAILIDLFQERRLKRPTQHVHFSEYRRGVLLFCVEERVDLEPVALTLHELMPNLPWDSEFHPLRLEADDALRTVIRGCLALWEEPAGVVS